MKEKGYIVSVLFLLIAFMVICPISKQADAAGKTLTVVGLYSETAAGHVSYRVGTGNWIVINVGDQIPVNTEIGITVDRDWAELCPSDNPNTVYEIDGNDDGKAVTMKVADLLKGKPKMVSFPKAGTSDPKFVNKAVVKQYLGR